MPSRDMKGRRRTGAEALGLGVTQVSLVKGIEEVYQRKMN